MTDPMHQVNGGAGTGTRVMWFFQGRESPGGVINKPPQSIVLGDVKKLYNGPLCHFLLKTPEGRVAGNTKFHWTLIIDDASPVPWVDVDVPVIVAKLRVIEKPYTTISYFIEGRNDSQIVRINKPASLITLLEVKDNFPGSYGTFLFKTLDPTGTFHWSVLLDNFSPVPALDGEVVVQIKMKNAAKTVIEITEELSAGLTGTGAVTPPSGPSYIRLDKPASNVTLQDIRPFYGGQPGIFLFKTPDGPLGEQFCWTVFANEHSAVPSFSEDTIVCKVKPVRRVNLQPQ